MKCYLRENVKCPWGYIHEVHACLAIDGCLTVQLTFNKDNACMLGWKQSNFAELNLDTSQIEILIIHDH